MIILNNTQSTEENIKVYLDSVQNVDKPALLMNLTKNEHVLQTQNEVETEKGTTQDSKRKKLPQECRTLCGANSFEVVRRLKEQPAQIQ